MSRISLQVTSILNEFDPKDPTKIVRRTLVTALHSPVNELNLGEITEERAKAITPGMEISCELTPDFTNIDAGQTDQQKATEAANKVLDEEKETLAKATVAPRAKSPTRH
jgi:hypothetical protein